MKIGIVTPTVSPERKPFLDFLKKRMEKTNKGSRYVVSGKLCK